MDRLLKYKISIICLQGTQYLNAQSSHTCTSRNSLRHPLLKSILRKVLMTWKRVPTGSGGHQTAGTERPRFL